MLRLIVASVIVNGNVVAEALAEYLPVFSLGELSRVFTW